jgi:DNA-binding NtrC family response regulator
MTTILVADDNSALADQYAYDLRRLAGHDVLIAHSGDEALATLASEPVDCLILDLEMPGTDGMAVLRALRERASDVPVIVYTGTGDFDRCAQAIRWGAHAFVDKADPMERIVREIELAIERRRILDEVARLRRYADDESALVGDSPAMHALKDAIGRVAPIPSPVLVVGESGSGKELVARDLHRLGGHAREPFVAVNSGALPEHLVESELFGHERGAFTGAATTRKGAFESAGRGTLFLDEIGELPAPAQATLLRVLEERQVVRVGSSRPVPAPARVVAATHRALAEDVQAGRFRRDLLYRLNVHLVHVPPLRDRLSDLPALVDRMLAALSERWGTKPKRIATGVLPILMAYDWRQNNVRELRNVIERMVIAADGDVIGPEHIPAEIREAPSTGDASTTDGAPRDGATPAGDPAPRTFLERKAEAERAIIVAALDRNDWAITRTAQDLGLADHASLLKIMRRHRITRD